MKYKILLANLCLFMITNSCFTNKMEGVRGFSNDISESQRRGVFICRVATDKSYYKFNDTLKLEVKEAFIEKGWGYGKHTDSTESNYFGDHSQKFQIVLVVNENCCTSSVVGIDWEISRSYRDSFFAKENGIIVNTYHSDSLSNIMIYNVLSKSSSKIVYPIDKRISTIALTLDDSCFSNN